MIEIIEYTDKYKNVFKDLNYEWIEKYFEVEQTDIRILSNPVGSIINKGGHIYIAVYRDKAIGTFALIQVDEDTVEVAKMAVTEQYQNRGIGRTLINFAIQKAKELNKSRIILYSNTSLAKAINMYFKSGFRVIPKNDFHAARSNIKMELPLKNNL